MGDRKEPTPPPTNQIKPDPPTRPPSRPTVLDRVDGLTQLDRAEQIARIAHRGQTDKAGADYIEHVTRVVHSVPDTLAKVVAFLHDVLEDNPRWTAFDLLRHGIEPAVVDAVVVLTKVKDEPYPKYIDRVATSGNALALAVKVADIDDHLTAGRCPENLVGRYRAAEMRLREPSIGIRRL